MEVFGIPAMGWSETLAVGPQMVPPTQGVCTPALPPAPRPPACQPCPPPPGWVQDSPDPGRGADAPEHSPGFSARSQTSPVGGTKSSRVSPATPSLGLCGLWRALSSAHPEPPPGLAASCAHRCSQILSIRASAPCPLALIISSGLPRRSRADRLPSESSEILINHGTHSSQTRWRFRSEVLSDQSPLTSTRSGWTFHSKQGLVHAQCDLFSEQNCVCFALYARGCQQGRFCPPGHPGYIWRQAGSHGQGSAADMRHPETRAAASHPIACGTAPTHRLTAPNARGAKVEKPPRRFLFTEPLVIRSKVTSSVEAAPSPSLSLPPGSDSLSGLGPRIGFPLGSQVVVVMLGGTPPPPLVPLPPPLMGPPRSPLASLPPLSASHALPRGGGCVLLGPAPIPLPRSRPSGPQQGPVCSGSLRSHCLGSRPF